MDAIISREPIAGQQLFIFWVGIQTLQLDWWIGRFAIAIISNLITWHCRDWEALYVAILYNDAFSTVQESGRDKARSVDADLNQSSSNYFSWTNNI